MGFYNYIRSCLFGLDAEMSHDLVTKLLGINPFTIKVNDRPVIVDGINYKNPIGLAAGFDKSGQLINSISKLGFGFMEVGTITPNPQTGNPKPRLWRDISNQSIINKMGFNNCGLSVIQKRLEKRKGDIKIIGNIGKGFDTPLELAFKDYNICFRGMRDLVDSFVINLSSPNTFGLRGLMREDYLSKICYEIQNENHKGLVKPIYVKISPDLKDLEKLVSVLINQGINGIVATNTLGVLGGGLSGRPITNMSLEMVKKIQSFETNLTIIGSGGIMEVEDVNERFQNGCKLVEVYSGLIWNGPFFVRDILKMK